MTVTYILFYHRSNHSVGDNVYQPLLSDEENLQVTELHQVDDADVEEKPHQKNINVRAAFIHVVGDIIQSLGVFVSSLIIKLKVWYLYPAKNRRIFVSHD